VWLIAPANAQPKLDPVALEQWADKIFGQRPLFSSSVARAARYAHHLGPLTEALRS